MLKFMFGFMHFQACHVLVRLGPGLDFKWGPLELLPGAWSSELVLCSSFLFSFCNFLKIIQGRFRLPDSRLPSFLRTSIQLSTWP